MDWSNPLSPLTIAVALVCIGFVLAIIGSNRKRDRLIVTLACMVMIGLAFLFALPEVTVGSAPPWRSSLAQRITELPTVVLTSVLYLTMAESLQLERPERSAYRVLVSRPKLHWLFRKSAVILGSVWVYALVTSLIFPVREVRDLYGAEPGYVFFLRIPDNVVPMLYLALAVWVSAKAISKSPYWIIKGKNASYSITLFLWLMGNCFVLAYGWAASFLDTPTRTTIVDTALTLQDYIFPLFVVGIMSAVLLTVGSRIPMDRLWNWIRSTLWLR